MNFKGQLEWTDYLDSQLLHMRSGKSRQIALYCILAAPVCALLYLIATGQIETGLYFLPALGLPIVFLLYRYVFLPRQIKKLFTQQKELSLPFELEITETGLLTSNELGNSTRPWGNFAKWKENEKLLLLYHSDIMFSIIPKRIFSEPQQVETVKAFLQKNKVSAAKSRHMAAYIIYIVLLLAVIWTVYSNLRGQ
ncbi:MAG: YcxB family protein [Anaerolineales bacterium]